MSANERSAYRPFCSSRFFSTLKALLPLVSVSKMTLSQFKELLRDPEKLSGDWSQSCWDINECPPSTTY